ncbi:GTP binding domain [Trypanosoma melophagium]|uniref:GTP binding domain n=1 Tax=Trypanosoma melophagium TaxID=715481 RepID=UPI00351AA788|nr:GTP binding domain [Trypanosoma melophagium]
MRSFRRPLLFLVPGFKPSPQPQILKVPQHQEEEAHYQHAEEHLTFHVKPPKMSLREKIVSDLSDEVFSKGNVHLKNVNTLSALPEGLHSFPEVCFIGKPNVGKSSIISCLLHNHRLGRSGRIRGTTRLLQFFNVGDALLLVDTPGYGGWKGRELSQNLVERAGAFAILFRYLALRKKGALKRLYWVMEASKPIQPRDEEILAFLQGEQIPFSLILNKIDRFHGDSGALQRQMEEIWEFVGSDKVPTLGVRSNPKFPEKCLNITALQNDITYYCTLDLTRTEDLTYKKFKELSYSPPSADDISAVERRYPVESFIVPREDNLSLEQFVLMHEEAKAKYLATSPKAAFLSSKEKIARYLSSCSDEENDTIEKKQRGSVDLTPLTTKISSTPLKIDASITKKTTSPSFDSSSSVANLSRRFRVRASLRESLHHSREDGFHLEERDTTTPEMCSAVISPKVDNTVPLPSSCSEGPVLPLVSTSVVPQLPPTLDTDTDTVRAINGIRIPKSMITASVAQLPATQEGSFEYFVQHSGARGYERLLEAEAKGEHTFVEEGEHASLFESDEFSTFRRPKKKSVRKKRLEMILEKYVARVRKPRSLYMQAEGYMCPWLAGAGQASRRVVVGMASNQCSMSGSNNSGGLMKGLKRTGFGGKSHSAYTLKNRGRATKKTGSWAT